MSKTSRELIIVLESQIDELYDKVNNNTISRQDAVVALRGTIADMREGIYHLKRDQLKRAFIVLGREQQLPIGNGKGTLKLTRELLYQIMSPGVVDGSVVTIQSGVVTRTPERIEIRDGTENSGQSSGEKQNLERKENEISSPIRSSPRAISQAARLEHVQNVESSLIDQLQAKIRNLEKDNEERKNNEQMNLQRSLSMIPSMHVDKADKTDRVEKKSSSKRLEPLFNSKSTRKHKKRDVVSSESDLSSSESDSSSSSSSSTSSSSSSRSDSARRHRRSKHYKRRSDGIKRHAKSFIRDSGRDGILVYVDRIKNQIGFQTGQLSAPDIRSFYEVESIAHALDAFIKTGTDLKQDGIEILVTRLIGVIHAIQTHDWSVMAAIQFKVSGTHTLPLSAKQLAKLQKQGARINALSTNTSKPRTNTRGKSYYGSSTPSDAVSTNTPSSGKNNQKVTSGSNNQSVGKNTTSGGTVSEWNSSKPQ